MSGCRSDKPQLLTGCERENGGSQCVEGERACVRIVFGVEKQEKTKRRAPNGFVFLSVGGFHQQASCFSLYFTETDALLRTDQSIG